MSPLTMEFLKKVTLLSSLLCVVLATPAPMSFNNALQQQSLHTVLLSIEERLRNLDSIYSMQFSPTVESKIEIYGRKLESIDSKLQRLQTIAMLNLDKISENISTKNFKDDIFKTNVFRKLDSTYEGITHRMGYIERKFETHIDKLYNKMENVLSKLDRMEETAAARDTDIEAEIADAIAAVDDVKTTCTNLEENLTNNTQKYLEASTKTNDLIERQHLNTKKAITDANMNFTKAINEMRTTIKLNNTDFTAAKESLEFLQKELKTDMNEYANKVADMYNEVYKYSKHIESSIETMSTTINLTKQENQQNLRNLMVQLGKLQMKDNIQSDSSNEAQKLIEINKKLDMNFEKMFLSQDLFLESCHRLQMDESQIESKISVILEKLIDTFEKKASSESNDLKKYENLLKTHDSNMQSNLHQMGNNVNRLYKKIASDNRKFESKADALGNALYVLIQDKMSANESELQILDIMQDLYVKLQKINLEIKDFKNQSNHAANNLQIEIIEMKTDLLENFSKLRTNQSAVIIDNSMKIVYKTNNDSNVVKNTIEVSSDFNNNNETTAIDTDCSENCSYSDPSPKLNVTETPVDQQYIEENIDEVALFNKVRYDNFEEESSGFENRDDVEFTTDESFNDDKYKNYETVQQLIELEY